MSVHAPDCECDTYGCQLRRKGVQVSPAGMVKHNGKPPAAHRYNQWEKGKAGEHRPDGTFMPYLNKTGDAIPIKHFAQGDYDRDKKALDAARAKSTTR